MKKFLNLTNENEGRIDNIIGIIINFAFLLLCTILIHISSEIAGIILLGYDGILLLVVFCRIVKRCCLFDCLYNPIAIINVGIIGYIAYGKYHLLYDFHTTITLTIAVFIGMIVAYLLNKVKSYSMSLWITVFISIMISLGCYGQLLLVNDVFSCSMQEVTFYVTDKVAVTGRAKQLIPDYYVTLENENETIDAFFCKKETFNQVEIGDTVNVKIHKGLLNVCYMKENELKNALGEDN